jgi:hypothetical protein
MDNQLNYQQARQIRNRSIKDLIADELIRGKGLGGAIGGAVNLRTQARIKGIKEKFDPLNIVKFLTFGSRLGPALYGKLFGRSRKDIEYFAGRASPIGERRKKITGIPGRGEGEDTSGMKVILKQILTFLQKSHEKDMILREKENNLRESIKLDDEKRHRDLLKALSNVGFGGTGETATKEKKGGLLDGIMNIINGLKQQLQSFIEDLKNVKNFLTGINWLSKLSWLRFAVNPYALAAMLVAAGIFAIYNNNKEIREAAAEGDVEKLKGYFANSTGTDADMAGVDQGYNKESVRSALEASAAKGSAKAQAALDNFDKLTTETSPVRSEKDLMNEYLSKKGFYDAGNGNYKSLLDSSKKPTQADFDAAKEYAKSKMASPVPQESTTPAPASAPVSPPMVNEAPKSSAVNTATDTNVSLNLSAPTSAEKNQAVQNKTNVVNQKSATGQKVPVPLVRNKEETFQRMIYNSLRLV